MKGAPQTPVMIKLNPADPLCLRASLGGLATEGFYCQLRYGPQGGVPQDFILMLERVLEALRAQAANLPSAPEAKYKD